MFALSDHYPLFSNGWARQELVPFAVVVFKDTRMNLVTMAVGTATLAGIPAADRRSPDEIVEVGEACGNGSCRREHHIPSIHFRFAFSSFCLGSQ